MFLSVFTSHRVPIEFVCVTDCIAVYGKCTGFTIYVI